MWNGGDVVANRSLSVKSESRFAGYKDNLVREESGLVAEWLACWTRAQ